MLPSDWGVRSDRSPDVPRPDDEPLRLDAGVLPPDEEALRPSDEPALCSEDAGLRGDVGFIGWLGTRPLRNLTLAAARLGVLQIGSASRTGRAEPTSAD